MLGTKENCYELSIYDSGIEFEIETLKKLGLERATTHKETAVAIDNIQRHPLYFTTFLLFIHQFSFPNNLKLINIINHTI